MYYYLIALQIRDLFTSDALVDVASGDVWRRIAETFLLDASVRSQMDPSAVRMIAGYIRQAYTRDMVQLSSAELSTISGILGETPTGGETGTPPGTPTVTGPGRDSQPGRTPGDVSGVSAGTSAAAGASQSVQESASLEAPGKEPGKAYEVSTPSRPQESAGTQLYAILGVIGIFCLLGAGYFFGPLKK